jgi:putative tryptophan/tyrosine transport system substrate-binding protein
MVLLAAVPLLAGAQPAGRVYRVGCVWAVPAHVVGPYRDALEQRLRELGWVEGQNIVFEHRFPNDTSEMPALVEDVLKTAPDIIVAASNRAVAAAAGATSTIPIVMIWGHDPVGQGFALSLARPGKNVTGLKQDPSPAVWAKQLELLKNIVPNADRVLVIKNGDMVLWSQTVFESIEAAARGLKVRLEVADVRGAADIERVSDQIKRSRVSAVLAFPDPLIFTHRSLIAQLAMKHRLPSVFWGREGVDAGGLASYGINMKRTPRDAAAFVDKILRGAKPAQLPIEEPTTYELVVNVKTAKALGMTIPPAVLLRADHVVE